MLPKRKKRERMGVRELNPYDIQGHRSFVKRYECSVKDKVPGHECWGVIDPHHYKTVGAHGQDDRNCVPLCRGHHSLLDSPGWSQKRLEEIAKVSFEKIAADLWKADTYHRRKFEDV
jgi:hypothetical protein